MASDEERNQSIIVILHPHLGRCRLLEGRAGKVKGAMIYISPVVRRADLSPLSKSSSRPNAETTTPKVLPTNARCDVVQKLRKHTPEDALRRPPIPIPTLTLPDAALTFPK
jgi:hypothetical protein